jgi:hypothetical protein
MARDLSRPTVGATTKETQLASSSDFPNAFRGFDQSVERAVGADMRLLYGMLVPILMICGVIVVLALSPATWLVVIVLVLELGALAVVGYGLAGMLNESPDDDAPGGTA